MTGVPRRVSRGARDSGGSRLVRHWSSRREHYFGGNVNRIRPMAAVLVAAACALAAPGAASADQRTSVAAASARANGTAVFDADGVRIRETPRLNGHVNGY